MTPSIESVVAELPVLRPKVNKGDRHRITHDKVKRGSLWIAAQTDVFRVLVSGEVDGLMTDFLRSGYGPEAGEDQGKKYWKVAGEHNIVASLRKFGAQ